MGGIVQEGVTGIARSQPFPIQNLHNHHHYKLVRALCLDHTRGAGLPCPRLT